MPPRLTGLLALIRCNLGLLNISYSHINKVIKINKLVTDIKKSDSKHFGFFNFNSCVVDQLDHI